MYFASRTGLLCSKGWHSQTPRKGHLALMLKLVPYQKDRLSLENKVLLLSPRLRCHRQLEDMCSRDAAQNSYVMR